MDRDVVRELAEVVVEGDEVGLAVDLEEDADLAAGVDVGLDEALARRARADLFAAEGWPFARSSSIARASVASRPRSSAALQSSIPAPVCSRSAFSPPP